MNFPEVKQQDAIKNNFPGGLNYYQNKAFLPQRDSVDTTDKFKFANKRYERTLGHYLSCVNQYFSQQGEVYRLEKERERRDIDTVCGLELFQVKREFLKTDILDYGSFRENWQRDSQGRLVPE